MVFMHLKRLDFLDSVMALQYQFLNFGKERKRRLNQLALSRNSFKDSLLLMCIASILFKFSAAGNFIVLVM